MKHSPKSLVIIFVAMFAVILLSSKWFTGMRIDLSESGLYTLSSGTEKILSSLDQPVSLTFYFSDKATTQLPALRTYARRVEELLREYESLADGKITFTKIDPEPFSEAEDEASLAGLQGVPGGIRGDDVYFGLVARNESGAEQVIPFMQPDREAFLEYELTRLISSLSKTSLPKIGIYSGLQIRGGFDYMTRQSTPEWAMLQYLEEGFELEWIDDDARKIEGVDVLLLVAPQEISDSLKFAIDQYVLAGGRALIFLDPYAESAAGMGGMPSVQRSDLADLMAAWGVKLREDEFVTDFENSMVVGVGQDRNPVRHIGLLSLAPSLDSDSIVLHGLERLNLSSAGIIDVLDDASTSVDVLLTTSSQAQPRQVDLLTTLHDPQQLMSGFEATGEQYALAARITGKASTIFPEGVEVEVVKEETEEESETEQGEDKPVEKELLKPELLASDNIQVMVISDSDFLTDRLWVQVQNFFGQQIVSAWADNGNLLINALENMSGHPDLISIRSQGRFNRPFERVDALRRDAEERFLAQQELLEEELGATESRLIELEKLRDEGDGAMFTAEQEKELLNFQEQKLKIRKQLRDVQHQLDQDIEALGTKLKLINIFLVPGLICLLILAGVARKRFA